MTCFFIAKAFRGQGLTVKLLKAAVRYAAENGAVVVEGYPIDPKGAYVDTFAYTGLASAFRRAGFKEVARPTPTRPVMRFVVKRT